MVQKMEGIIKEAALDLLEAQLAQQKVMKMSASGSSMLPTIYPGDIFEVTHRSVRPIYKNDIVLIRFKEKLVLHRVRSIQSKEGLFLTQGDNALRGDAPVLINQILGVVSSPYKSCGLVRRSYNFVLLYLMEWFNQVRKYIILNQSHFLIKRGLFVYQKLKVSKK